MNRIVRRERITRRSVLLFLAPILLTPHTCNSEGPNSAPAATQSNKSSAQKPQVFELRIYHAAPGKMDALNKRFRDHTLRLFNKYGIKSIGYWIAEGEKGGQSLYYIIAYPDRESREKMLVNGIAVDPEFRKVVEESEMDGELTTKIESLILNPTDYSPLK